MTPEVEKKRRELFEAKFTPPYYVTWNVDRKAYYSIHRDSTRKRVSENYDAKWHGFNAALDAVEIVFPPEWPPVSEKDEGANEMLEACRLSIYYTGLGLRIKE